MGLRITFLGLGAALLYASLSLNLYKIQILKGEYYSSKANSLYNSSGVLEAPRGDIYLTDRAGNAIAVTINKDYPTIFSNNKKVEDPKSAAEELSKIVNKPAGEILAMLQKKDDPYEPILKKASDLQAAAVKEKKIKGIDITYETGRFYPFDRMASHVLGFVSTDSSQKGKGLYGVEASYNDSLKGSAGKIEDGEFTPAVKGADLNLTIDRNIQAQAEKILKKLVDTYDGTGGTVIVQDPKTGKVLAMANYPDFDPNNYGSSQIKNFLNPAVQSIYEPGSIMKVVTMAAAIDAGKITPETTYVDTGSLVISKKTIRNAELKSYGRINMTNVIERSVNTGAVFAERAMGHEIFYDYLSKFGFKKLTGIDLPGEITGGLRVLEKNVRDVNFATASYGQGISVSPIGLINAVSAIANRGVMMKPYINADKSPEAVSTVISEETSKKVVGMMVSAVNKNEVAKISGYNVAGKTGTAQVPDFKRGGYSDDVINTYVGFAPAYDPKFVILVKLDKPYGSPQAALTVVPSFRELAEFMLNYYSVPPDNVSSK